MDQTLPSKTLPREHQRITCGQNEFTRSSGAPSYVGRSPGFDRALAGCWTSRAGTGETLHRFSGGGPDRWTVDRRDRVVRSGTSRQAAQRSFFSSRAGGRISPADLAAGSNGGAQPWFDAVVDAGVVPILAPLRVRRSRCGNAEKVSGLIW